MGAAAALVCYTVHMQFDELLRRRLQNQRLAGGQFATGAAAVRWLGAVQSQDFGGAMWAAGQRVEGSTFKTLNEEFARGAFLRTHALRPTWHFVAPEDIRWMLELSKPHLETLMRPYFRKFDLDDATLKKTNAIIVEALAGGKELTRAEIAKTLQAHGVDTGDTIRLTHIMLRAELDGLICSGAVRGKQQTYALLELRAPNVETVTRETATAQLAARYFQSHGPATIKDFSWWSGLGVREATAALQAAEGNFVSTEIDGKTFWHDDAAVPNGSNDVYLLANYDEYTVAYADRTMIFDNVHLPKLDSRQNALFTNVVVARGKILGTWKRTFSAKGVTIETKLFEAFSAAETAALRREAERYGAFFELTPTLHITQG